MTKGFVQVASEDERMNAAISEAKQNLPLFLDAYAKRTPTQSGFHLKARFESGDDVEHVWIKDVESSMGELRGTIANDPKMAGIEFGQRIALDKEQVTDWMYLDNGYLVGGYTVKAVRAGLSASERAQFDAGAPYKFRD